MELDFRDCFGSCKMELDLMDWFWSMCDGTGLHGLILNMKDKN